MSTRTRRVSERDDASPSASASTRPNRRQRVGSVAGPSTPPTPTPSSSATLRPQPRPLTQPRPLSAPFPTLLPLSQPASSSAAPIVGLATVSASTPGFRDGHFYKMDGNCIVRVGDTLFKIHKHLLAPESDEHALFGALLALALEDSEGDSDERPIILEGDTPDDLRAYLRFLYSNPLQLRDENITVADLPQLAVAGRFANKYRIESFEEWVKLVVTGKLSQPDALRGCSDEAFLELLRFSQTCAAPILTESVFSAWARHKLGAGADVAGVVARMLTLNGCTGDVKTMVGVMHYAQLLSLNQARPLPEPRVSDLYTPIHISSTSLGDTQHLRLLQAHRSLSLSWARITDHLLFHIQLCSNQCPTSAVCHNAWRTAVRVALLAAPDQPDYDQMLRTLQEMPLQACVDTKNRTAGVLREVGREWTRRASVRYHTCRLS
ncbi:BTB domain-containing protein [Mycena indigotica]|uniref:BTB domain-containing protein n=1 Tax=Mycena indigotica TaxID=2126181 RepID=A0A8H6RZG5_9AGAR|nr:BTB domain-containing protein [Mycena indigotica]KAF7289702.1 BTB domain-containing protein [Mycena indigotica]